MNVKLEIPILDKLFQSFISSGNRRFKCSLQSGRNDMQVSQGIYTLSGIRLCRQQERRSGPWMARLHLGARYPGQVDLAVIITPAAVVPHFVRECGEKGIKNMVIESAGFSEQGEDGKRLQARDRRSGEEARHPRHGPQLPGRPGQPVARFCCFYGAYQEIWMCSTNRAASPTSYRAAASGVVMLESLMDDIVGLNKMVSIGNKSDVDEADLIEYFNHDNTKVIALYLENIRGRQKADGTRARGTIKPILVFKSGRTAEGTAAALSHTAGMANNDTVFESACRQAGIITAQVHQRAPFDAQDAHRNAAHAGKPDRGVHQLRARSAAFPRT